MPVLFRFAQRFKKIYFDVRLLEMTKTGISKNIENFAPTLHRNSCAEVKLFFTARCVEVTESIDIKTTVNLQYRILGLL